VSDKRERETSKKERREGRVWEKLFYSSKFEYFEKRRRPACGKPVYSMKKYPSQPNAPPRDMLFAM
jgi:hypothetical protein